MLVGVGGASRQPQIVSRSQRRLGLELDRLRKQSASPSTQHLGERIVDIVRLVKSNNVVGSVQGTQGPDPSLQRAPNGMINSLGVAPSQLVQDARPHARLKVLHL